MSKFFKATAAALVALAAAQTLAVSSAEAGPRQRFIGGLIAGAVVSTIVAGSIARERAYASEGCGYLRDRAVYNQDIGRPARAQYWWDRYAACRG